MLARAQEHILLIDHSKFELPNLEVVCPLSEVHRVVTDQAPPAELGEALAKARVEVLF
jgi:DeoR/GlpR family transcriptional regulator of sugar metabolism